MTKRKFNLAKLVWLTLLCFGIIFFSANNSQALPTPYHINVTNIIANGPSAGTPYLTQYWLDTEEFGVLDAFCVENVNANSGIDYALVSVPIGLSNAAGLANLYYNQSVLALSSIDNQTEAKVVTQLAIWQILGIATTTDSIYSSLVADILALDYTSYSDSIYLAQSPPNGSTGPAPSQDYLVSVPDASIMFLLGSAFMVLGLYGRKKSKGV